MNRDVTELRKDYELDSLNIEQVANNPIDQFDTWFRDAVNANIAEPNAMTLATSENNRPSARIVLLKGFDRKGFIFYTNYESRKGKQLLNNSFAALTFFWAELERQVRVEGKTEQIPSDQSDEYFLSRPRGSRLGAWASPQSQLIASREILSKRMEELQKQYPEGSIIPRPTHWGGFCVKPYRIEFWQGRKSRLHDRVLYELTDDQWAISRLAP